jgi:predicted dinucleotide-binding enzyme
MPHMSRIAIVGAGSVGRALATGLERAGHEVVIGVRDPGHARHHDLTTKFGLHVPADAATGSEVVILAVPVAALAETVPALGLTPGQVLVDATNAVRTPPPDGFATVGAFVASIAPGGVAVVKAFNTIGAEHLGTGRVADTPAFLPIAGDDAGRSIVASLGTDLGFDVAELGGPDAIAMFGAGLADRNEAFRTRILQTMILGALVLRPIPAVVASRVESFARAMSVDDGMLAVARRFASGQLGLAAFDFQRNGYTADWSPERARALHTSTELTDAWQLSVNDAALAARWAALEQLPADTLGRRMWEFYRARGFAFPGLPGSAPPLLAQHDWVHVLVDYGTKVESELEVFAFIARANDDPRGFSLLAMVVSLFETGYLATGAGLFESFPGQLSHDGMAGRRAAATVQRHAQVLTRGALGCRRTMGTRRHQRVSVHPRRGRSRSRGRLL